MIKDLIEHIVKQLVDKPESATVEQEQGGPKLVIHIRVDVDDMKRVIGKEGKTIKALRMLSMAVHDDRSVDIVLDSNTPA
jgi:predicted RNA-binding protein YlqC (UPF0109 family)